MSAATIQEMVAEKIKTLYRVSHELEELFSGRHYREALYARWTYDREHWRGAGGLLLWADAV